MAQPHESQPIADQDTNIRLNHLIRHQMIPLLQPNDIARAEILKNRFSYYTLWQGIETRPPERFLENLAFIGPKPHNITVDHKNTDTIITVVLAKRSSTPHEFTNMEIIINWNELNAPYFIRPVNTDVMFLRSKTPYIIRYPRNIEGSQATSHQTQTQLVRDAIGDQAPPTDLGAYLLRPTDGILAVIDPNLDRHLQRRHPQYLRNHMLSTLWVTRLTLDTPKPPRRGQR